MRLDHLRVRPLRDEQACASVPQVVDAEIGGNVRRVTCWISNPSMEPIVPKRAALRAGEDQGVRVVRESFELRSEEGAKESRHRDRTNAAGLGLTPVELPVNLRNLRERLGDGKALPVDVNTPAT